MGWWELRNKLEAFYFFTHADAILELASGARLVPLQHSVTRARALEAFHSFWVIEGLGYHYARAWDGADTRGDRPFAAEAGTLLSGCTIPLQAGAGLWLAESSLATNHDDETLSKTYLQLGEHINNGFSYIAYEALGLVIRNLRPRLIGPLGRRFAGSSKELQACFWHGIGRGTYFARTTFLPYRYETLQGFAECRNLPPHELGRINAVSGFAWALTLVNLRHPEIVERFLHHSVPDMPEDDAFGNGVLCALTVWLKSHPNNRLAHYFCQHRPTRLAVRRLWEAYITRPCDELLRQPTRIESQEAERLFRYQPLHEFFQNSPCEAKPSTS